MQLILAGAQGCRDGLLQTAQHADQIRNELVPIKGDVVQPIPPGFMAMVATFAASNSMAEYEDEAVARGCRSCQRRPPHRSKQS